MTRTRTFTLTIARHLLEHPHARHLRRMRTTIFLYLLFLARAEGADGTQRADLDDLARTLGLPRGTVRSWLGRLARQRYLTLTRRGGALWVALPDVQGSSAVEEEQAIEGRDSESAFTVASLQAALGEKGNDASLRDALTRHPSETVKRALAGALAPPAEKIRRSRTALFLYLLTHHAHETPSDPARP